MLIPSSRTLNIPVLSLHVAAPIARTIAPIIDPSNLQIVAMYIDGPALKRNGFGNILDLRSVREFSNLGMIINSTDDLLDEDDAIRLKKVLDINFQLIDKKVVTKKGTKLGKVVDYILDPETFQIMQIVVKRPAFKAILDPELLIGLSQIAKVTDEEIVVKNEEEKVRKETAKKDFVPNFVNPFREPHFAPAQSQTPDEKDTE